MVANIIQKPIKIGVKNVLDLETQYSYVELKCLRKS